MLFVIDNAHPQVYSQKFRSILSHANKVGKKIDATLEHHFSPLATLDVQENVQP